MTKLHFHYIVNGALTIACFVHLCYLGYYVVHPEFPTITVYQKDLQDIDFPITFRLCINEIENGSARFRRVGYKSFGDMFYGESLYNETIYGWRGHFENGSTFNSVNGNLQEQLT